MSSPWLVMSYPACSCRGIHVVIPRLLQRRGLSRWVARIPARSAGPYFPCSARLFVLRSKVRHARVACCSESLLHRDSPQAAGAVGSMER